MTPQQFYKTRSTSKFFARLMEHVLPRIRQNVEQQTHVSIFRHGTESELYISSILSNYLDITTYLEELINLPKTYLNVDRKKILILYGKKFDFRDYYIYQYDNIVIRVLTSLDLCGKIGNRVFKLGINEDKCNWYQFTNHKKLKGTTSAKNLESFAKEFKKIKTYRHQKVHRSKTDDKNPFEGLVNWEYINKTIGGTIDQRDIDNLGIETDSEIKSRIKELNVIISKAVRLTFNFFDTLIPELENHTKQKSTNIIST